jgi:hypothetical protein
MRPPPSRTGGGQDKPPGHMLRPMCLAPDCDWSGALYWDCPECRLIAQTTADQLRGTSAPQTRGERLTEPWIRPPPLAAEPRATSRADVRSLSTSKQLIRPSSAEQPHATSAAEQWHGTSTAEETRTQSAAELLLDSTNVCDPLRRRCEAMSAEEYQLYLSDIVKCCPCSLDEVIHSPDQAEEIKQGLIRPDESIRPPWTQGHRGRPKTCFPGNTEAGEKFCNVCCPPRYLETADPVKNPSEQSHPDELECRPIGDKLLRHGPPDQEGLPQLASPHLDRGPPVGHRPPPPSHPPIRPPVPANQLPPPSSPQQLLRSTAQLLGVDLVRKVYIHLHTLRTFYLGL